MTSYINTYIYLSNHHVYLHVHVTGNDFQQIVLPIQSMTWQCLQVLAEQHIMKLEQLLQGMPLQLRPACAILTGSTKAKERKAIYAGLADGSISIIVGTHALITDALEFKRLGVAVIDEQHR